MVISPLKAGEPKYKMQKSLLINLNSLHQSGGNIRFLETKIELLDLHIKKCSFCGVKESRFGSLPQGAFLSSPEDWEFEVIHFYYKASERGAHSFELDAKLSPVYNNSRGFPNTYHGRESYSDHAFIFYNTFHIRPKFWAVRGVNSDELNRIGVIYGGNSGVWAIVTDVQLHASDNYNLEFIHNRCQLINDIDATLDKENLSSFTSLLKRWNEENPDDTFCGQVAVAWQNGELKEKLKELKVDKLEKIINFLSRQRQAETNVETHCLFEEISEEEFLKLQASQNV